MRSEPATARCSSGARRRSRASGRIDLGAQLAAILEAVGKVSELELDGVEPTSHPLDLVNVWGDDEPRPSLPLDEALANTSEREGNAFKVPPSAAVEDAP